MPKRPKQETTERRIESYQGSKALLETWEAQPQDVLIREHDYLVRLRTKVRMQRQLILHRADPKAFV